MLNQIKKDEVFNSILNGDDVFIVKETTWVNCMAVGDIAQLSEDAVFLVEKKKKVEHIDGVRRIDVRKFTDKLHDENMSQADLSRIAGVNINTIYNYARGTGCPRTGKLARICKALKCEPRDILA